MKNSVLEVLEEMADPRYKTDERYYRGYVNVINALPEARLIGVHVPDLKKFAKFVRDDGSLPQILEDFERRASGAKLPGAYDVFAYEEKLFWSFLIALIRDPQERIERMRRYVPYISNWAECDSFCSFSKFKAKDKARLLEFIEPYFRSKREFEVRFGVVMGMCNLIDDEHLEVLFDLLTRIDYEGISSDYVSMKIQPYYVKMAVAWTLATCLAKFPDRTRAYVNAQRGVTLGEDVIKLYVRKSRESFRTREIPAL